MEGRRPPSAARLCPGLLLGWWASLASFSPSAARPVGELSAAVMVPAGSSWPPGLSAAALASGGLQEVGFIGLDSMDMGCERKGWGINSRFLL